MGIWPDGGLPNLAGGGAAPAGSVPDGADVDIVPGADVDIVPGADVDIVPGADVDIVPGDDVDIVPGAEGADVAVPGSDVAVAVACATGACAIA